MIVYFTKALLLLFSVYTTESRIPEFDPAMRSVKEIPLPAGFERIPVQGNFFQEYLRNLPLRKDKTIYLYNKRPKFNQSLHYAVIDVSTGEKDLQQCADAIMRLRAEYFYQKGVYDSICFPRNSRSVYQFSQFVKTYPTKKREGFMKFMETVFINCGTCTLEQQLKPVKIFSAIQMADVFIKGGAPGHAEIVVDMAVHKQTGKKIFMLAEGYMPAQDIHILLNPLHPDLGPWYEVKDEEKLTTASWIFSWQQLKRW